MGTYLAFDYGSKRIGLAVGQTITGSANPLSPVRRHDGRPDWERIDEAINAWQPDALVVGLPSHADGTRHSLADDIEAFCGKLSRRYGRGVHTIDERLTSHEARQQTGSAEIVDSVAAALILETWFSELHRN